MPSRRTSLSTALFSLLIVLTAATALGADGATPPPEQVREWDVDGLEALLPRHEIAWERERWLGREETMPNRTVLDDPPPLAPIRNCGEWEPCSGVLIRYPLGVPYQLLRDLDDQVTLHIVVSSSYLSSAQSNLAAQGVDMDQVEFLVRANDSIWTRDYGPWFIFDGDGEIAVIDHTYNRPWRPNDNLIPIYFAQEYGLPVHSHSMYHTGGNYMTDGAHISSSTRLVYNEAASENGMTPAEVDQLMADYYGVETYAVLEYIEGGGIHHIDTWAKFLDEETVLVKEVWQSHHTYTTLEQRATLLASLTASTGRPYQVHRVYCYNIGGGSPASYTNSLFLNDHVYVPTFGNASYDADALAAYESACPGYVVNGYYYSGWLTDDALHCRAKGVMDAGMLRVAHVALPDRVEGTATVDAHVRAHSGAALTAVDVVYRHEGGDWTTTAMTAVRDHDFTAEIPVPSGGGRCDYYVLAADADDRSEGMPRTAPNAWYSFQQDATTDAPDDLPDAAGAAVLHANYPNPFNPGTTFRFELRYPEAVRLVVLDLRGRLVRTLVDGERGAGSHTVSWDGADDSGRTVAAGTYLYRLQAAGLQYTRSATLVR